MKKRALFLLGFLCLYFSGWAQNNASKTTEASGKGAGKITGTVLDSVSGKPVAFATVALAQMGGNPSKDGTLTDDQGRFTFSPIPVGEYQVTVSFIGYQTKNIRPVKVIAGEPEVKIGRVTLSPAENKLKEVTVVGQKPLVEDKIDRLVYNADQDITNVGGNASDVLRKVPSLSVDVDGNVQLRGSSNVRVLINNKASTMLATNLADALRQIPSDQIKSVEVITSPSAKYDAEGSAGIINIITKRNSLPGLTGSIGATAGTQNSSVFSNLSMQRGKMGVTLNLNGFRYSVPKGYGLYRVEHAEGEDVITRQTGDGRVHGGGASAELGLTYDPDSLNLFSVGLKMNTGRYQGSSAQETTTTQPGPFPYIRNASKFQFIPLGADVNLEYTHVYKPQQELTLLGQFSQSDHENFVHQDRFTRQDQLFYLQRNTNQNSNREITFQADYGHPFKNKATLEVGAKAILRRANSDAQYDITYPLEDRAAPEENTFHYRQDVVAGYLFYGVTLGKKNTLKTGLRWEQTQLKGDFTSTQTFLNETYHHLIPSLVLSRTLKENHTLKFSYTQRLQRPHIFLLNPYRDNRDPKSIFFGNPALDPELTHLYEAGYSTFFKTSSLSAALYLQQVDNAIQLVTLGLEDGVSQNTYENAGKLLSYGVNVSGATKPVPAVSLNGNANVYYNRLSGLGTENTGWQYNLNVTTGYELGKGLTAQFSGGFNSARVTLQGKAYAWQYYNFAVKKALFEKRGSLTLGVNNPFTKSINYGSETRTEAFTQVSENRNFNRSVRLSFDFKFGQQNASKTPRKQKSIRNDDMKEGE
ncbi:TonB-dependent receptor domain-containing protein [Rufibacter sediminis]|uniref:TonB-dependent receptor n=1 Tax=Rufibacter sediminis TaxID=2762756 RepID=A0ABR6VU80_9BACT|nr:outer membrane beta-barrel family protein [Rufibacter sediminis]MBC3540716.1 TonB-dependent receptor [Rufibacter sediminis]